MVKLLVNLAEFFCALSFLFAVYGHGGNPGWIEARTLTTLGVSYTEKAGRVVKGRKAFLSVARFFSRLHMTFVALTARYVTWRERKWRGT